MSNQTYATVVYTAAHHKRLQLALKKYLITLGISLKQ